MSSIPTTNPPQARLAAIREQRAPSVRRRLERRADADPDRRQVLVCTGGGCQSSRSAAVAAALQSGVAEAGLNGRVEVVPVGCMGLCGAGPLVLVAPDGVIYQRVGPDEVSRIVGEHLGQGRPVRELELCDRVGEEELRSFDVPFFARQVKIALRNCGVVDPTRIDDYLALDGYRALEEALFTREPDEVLGAVKRSGLRGRGGAGFPAGLKWQFVRQAEGPVKYVVCNADEGDPGAFMDRSILEGDPHSVIEGMTIAARVVGATRGYVYVRAEYPLAIERLQRAIEQARELGVLGRGILGSGVDFDLEIRIGAGAFVCGEETALLHSIEGKRGTPRPRPPFPAQSGLWAKPTLLSNVETWANVAPILLRGAEWFAGIGTERSKGTKVFALAGAVRNTGMVEVPMGISLREVVDEIGGGIGSGLAMKAAQSGGPSGGCIPSAAADVPVDYESLQELGAIMGSGGLIVLDESTCMVELARFFLEFLVDESCGKCPPCRIGTTVMLNVLERITNGHGTLEDLDTLERLARHISTTSLCGLGQTAPNAVVSTLRHFRSEYLEHIEEGHCRACSCRGLVAAPCSHACPAGVDIPRYVRALQQGSFEDAYLVVRERIPLPLVCGLVCFAPCEQRCRRAQLDASVAIRKLKWAAVEYGSGAEPEELERAPASGKRVAVVGSGPSGLTAAYYLAVRGGHEVTVLEERDEVGGMLRYGIPAYRLPPERLDEEIARVILAAGVKLVRGARVESAAALLEEGYDAVYLAVGAHRGMALGLEGEDGDGVLEGVDLLRRVAEGNPPALGRDVLVVGGGNTAVDAARTARRLGAERVTIAYRRSRAEMPADPSEIAAAEEEGIELRELVLPTGLARDGGRLRVTTVRMRLGTADDSGRRRPEPVPGSESVEQVDALIAAIGQRPAGVDGLGVELRSGGWAEVDARSLATSRAGVFAGGDFVLGPASVIEAIAQGRRAAEAIDRALGGTGDIAERLTGEEELDNLPPLTATEESSVRVAASEVAVADRLGGFVQVERGYSRGQATAEAGRCLRCDLERGEVGS